MASSSPFLALPAELRNNIYGFASLADTPYQLKPRCKVQQARHLLTTCPLILTNHEVAEEYYAVLAKLSTTNPQIKLLARVTDFNFRHLIRFLTTEISGPQLAEAGAAKRLIIELTITAVGSIDPERYSDWVNFCQKRDVSAGYTVNNAASGVTFDSSDFMAWEGLGKADRETMKICCALRDWRQFRNLGMWSMVAFASMGRALRLGLGSEKRAGLSDRVDVLSFCCHRPHQAVEHSSVDLINGQFVHAPGGGRPSMRRPEADST
ncbi:hypothetical protein B0A55_06071 [Friedmanniomyces simplex]|uniref:Uncharacterized protein n=1 Tax=Friedmanniomyces simplex TaxID=329884 RepID=A0A4U0XBY6_9PEZI|nr:hypothetical protein B0A55_06071 [Friedmanniomyces simplex]